MMGYGGYGWLGGMGGFGMVVGVLFTVAMVALLVRGVGAYQQPELAKLEQAMIVDQAKEIAQMRAWHRAWYPAG